MGLSWIQTLTWVTLVSLNLASCESDRYIATVATNNATTTTAKIYSVAIDTFSLAKGIDFTNHELVTASRKLAPSMLRIGGSAQRSYPICSPPANHPEAWNATCLTQRYFTELCDFAFTIGAELLFGLDAHAIDASVAFIQSLAQNGSSCPALKAFSIGNEGVPGSCDSFRAVHAALAHMDPRPLLVGPDAAITPWALDYFVPLAENFINECGVVLDATSFHVYSFQPNDIGQPTPDNLARMSALWNATKLDVIGDMISVFKKAVANTLSPKLPMWLTETNSICDGGIGNLSNTFGNTHWLLNQLGVASLAEIPMMALQTLVGEDYGLLSGVGDRSQEPGWLYNVTARPNFFVNYLHSQLCGDVVLRVVVNTVVNNVSSVATSVRGYGYCTPTTTFNTTTPLSPSPSSSSTSPPPSPSPSLSLSSSSPSPSPSPPQSSKGAVTLVFINFGLSAINITVPFNGPNQLYGLSGLTHPLDAHPPPHAIVDLMTSPNLYVNGQGPLQLNDVPVPSITNDQISIPALGAAIVVAPQANAITCM